MNNQGIAALTLAALLTALLLAVPKTTQPHHALATVSMAAETTNRPSDPAAVMDDWETLTPAEPVAADFDENDVYQGRPGLLAIWLSDPPGRAISQIEPHLAFRFKADEAPHPSLSPHNLRGKFAGTLNVRRPGRYRFDAVGTGELRLVVNRQTVFEGRLGSQPKTPDVWIELEFGPAQMLAEYTSDGQTSPQLQTYWRRDGDVLEPISARSLGRSQSQETPAVFDQTTAFDEGQRLFAELRCDACHAIDNSDSWLARHREASAPELASVAHRVRPGWLYRWLENPHTIQHTATMPALFSDSPTGHVERYAVWAFLAWSSDSEQTVDAALAKKGELVFEQTGCIACHTKPGETPKPGIDLRPLDGIGSKLTAAAIREKIAEPGKHFPGSWMPDFELDKDAPEQLDALVAYLSQSTNSQWEKAPTQPDWELLSRRWYEVSGEHAAKPVDQLGRWVLQYKGCLDCHQYQGIDRSGAVAPALRDLARNTQPQSAGCLSPSPSGVPDFDLTDTQRQALFAFVSAAPTVNSAVSRAPFHEAQWRLEKLGCTACHEYHGAGGVFGDRIASFIPEGSDKTPLDLSPPDLTSVGEKLLPDWLRGVILQGKRARPWMSLRMPIFNEKWTRDLPEMLIRADGVDVEYQPEAVGAVSEESLTAARDMVGRNVFNCVSCHDVLGHEGTGTRGPDLAGITQRVKQPWFRRWLLDPQRITPGTRMPSIFANGRSMAPQFLGGEPEQQIDALWAYFSQGRDMRMPLLKAPWELPVAGGEDPHFQPTDRPLLLRGFMIPHAGLRAAALGFPEKTHFAFDTQSCTLTTVWTGDFAQVGGWMDNGRGSVEDNGIQILGDILWSAPDRFPISVHATLQDGTPLECKVRYTGCWASPTDAGFGYRLIGKDLDVQVEHRPSPIANSSTAFQQQFSLSGLPKQSVVKIAVADVREGESVLVADRELASEDTVLVERVPQVQVRQGDVTWHIAAIAEGAHWQVAGPVGSGRDAYRTLSLVIPASANPRTVTLRHEQRKSSPQQPMKETSIR